MLPTVKISFFQKTNSLPAWPAAATFDAKSSQKLLAEWRQRTTQDSLYREEAPKDLLCAGSVKAFEAFLGFCYRLLTDCLFKSHVLSLDMKNRNL